MKFYSHFVSQVSPSAAQVGSVYLERQMSNSNVHTSLMSLEVFSLPPSQTFLKSLMVMSKNQIKFLDVLPLCPC